MQQAPSPRSSLARSTLLKMGVRIAVVIALTTLFSYLHLASTMRDEALRELEQHILERGQLEDVTFVLAEDNHAVLKKALAERLQTLRPEELGARFDSLFAQSPDGAVRNRPEGFDGTRMVCLFAPRGVTLDDDLRRRILASYDVVTQYGPAFHTRFTDTFITLPEGAILLYWPESPTYCQDASPTEALAAMEYFTITLPDKNPERRTAWSGVYVEPVSKAWLTTASTPLDVEGRHVATISHDVPVQELLERTRREHLPGAYNLLVREDGQLIVHPRLKVGDAQSPYNILDPAGKANAGASALDSPELQEQVRHIFDKVMKSPADEIVQELPALDAYVAATRLKGPGWFLITVLPESTVSQPALDAARYVLLLGLASLILELAIMSWVLRQQITRPLLHFAEASAQVGAGDFKVQLDASRQDELGLVAGAFQRMANEVQQREEELRRANEGLEQRVEERTRELKQVHQQLVQTARQAGMAEVATNVLHNVGNVLNSVYTSSQIAKERLGELRLESVGRLAAMLDEHQEDLAAFFTQSERGRQVRPFLSRLGQNLVEERQEILTLLDDVGRYTEHVGDIVKLQQNHARVPRLNEPVLLETLIEDALRINSAALGRHQVKVERKLAPLPPVLTDKHKVLMILINLISNAKYALGSKALEERRLGVRLHLPLPDRFRLEISDNGMGIAPELLTRIFQYGFTTRVEGHGFGLHSCALAAQELGGTLTVHSDGPGHGATFTLELPYVPVQETV